MEQSPSPRRRRLVCLLLLVLSAVGAAAYLVPARRNADRIQRILDDATAGATVLRVWGAGVRGGTGFCRCASVPKSERVFYETRDSAEIRAFGSLLRARLHLEPDPLCRCCGQITIDFLRGEEILLSIHPHGELRSNRGVLPITPASSESLEQWISKRSIRENILQAMRPR